MPRVLLLQVGHTFEEVARERGDYDRWFRHGLGLDPRELEVVRVFDGQPLPHGWDHDGIVITGSWSMVTDREAWSEATAEYLREAVMRQRALLGVCYGHQLLAHALGGQVGYNPKGRHAGTDRITLTEAAKQDPLFESFEDTLTVQVSHSQSVLELPAEAVLLGHCAMDPHHAFRIGQNAWAVQFHPEFDEDVSRRYIELRRATIQAEGLDPDRLLAGVRESLDGRLLLRKFVQLIG
jgi:GMP synthase (glutamine-hydrolysing)